VGGLLRYLAGLTSARACLWCYLLWYLVMAIRYFDPSPRLWGTSVGLSAIIGIALLLNARSGALMGGRMLFWPTFRFFLIPFCVSSFSALVKGRGFFLIFSPNWRDTVHGALACAAFLALIPPARAWRRHPSRDTG